MLNGRALANWPVAPGWNNSARVFLIPRSGQALAMKAVAPSSTTIRLAHKQGFCTSRVSARHCQFWQLRTRSSAWGRRVVVKDQWAWHEQSPLMLAQCLREAARLHYNFFRKLQAIQNHFVLLPSP